MAPPNPPLFRLSSDPKPSVPFAPPASNIPSNGLFSAASTPVPAQRSYTTPATLFAGSTPGFKPRPRNNRGLSSPDSPDQTPKFSLGGATRGRGKYDSPTDGDDEDEPRIFEDDTGDEDTTHQEEYDDEDTTHRDEEYDYDDDDEEEMDMTGLYDESDDADESYDLLQSRHAESVNVPETHDMLKPGTVPEPGTLIMQTEELMDELARAMAPKLPAYGSDSEDDLDMDVERPAPPLPEKQEENLTRASKYLLETLASHLPKPDPKSRLHKAYYIASLLLPLHHSRANVPETLRKWLYTHKQNPTRAQLHSLKSFHPNCVFSPNYWPTLHALVLRGELQEALSILNTSNWDALRADAPAIAAPKLPQPRGIETRYTRGEINAVKTAVAVCVRLLDSCPGLTCSSRPGLARSSYAPSSIGFFPNTPTYHGSPADWRIWQGSVYAASDELRSRNTEETDEEDGNYMYRPRAGFGLGGGRRTVLPVEVARGLRGLYEVMRGERDAIIAETVKWEDAVCGLMFWNVAGSTGRGGVDESVEEEESDEEEVSAVIDRARREKELLRLRRTTESVVEELPLDPTAELQLAAGAVMTWDTSVLGDILARFSLLVASAVVEICGWAGSIDRTPLSDKEKRRRGGMLAGFDDDEIAVLAMRRNEVRGEAAMADAVCVDYACGLCALEWVDEGAEFEGWEAGVGVLERVRGGREIAGKLLTQLELTSKARVEKLLTYCNENNLTEESSDIAALFATHLTTTASHGDALHFYSLSPFHRSSIHRILTHLLTSTLLTSSAVPSAPDATLTHLLSSPASSPPILRFELSGYATMRAFYAHRDNAEFPSAARALVAAIKSAGEKLDGGVLDREWECAVEPWMLGVLLGEILPFLDGKVGVRECYDVMKVVTDFEIVGGEVARSADEFLKRALAARNGGEVGAETRASTVTSGGTGAEWEDVKKDIDTGALVPEPGAVRRWDWRDRFVGMEGKIGIKEVVALVRLRLSKEVARAWLEDED